MSAASFLSTFLCISVLLLCIQFANGTPEDFDCPMRQFLLEYATDINADLTPQQLQQIADALNGTPRAIFYGCNVTPSMLDHAHANVAEEDDAIEPIEPLDENDNDNNDIPTIYVSVDAGNDENPNYGLSIDKPLQTLSAAIRYARKLFGRHQHKQILMAEGTYYLQSTIFLSYLDSNLLIQPLSVHDRVNISGALPLDNLNWRYYQQSHYNHAIYSVHIPTVIDNETNVETINGLRIDGYRGIRARYPNVQSEETFPPETYSLYANDWDMRDSAPTTQYSVNTTQFVRNDTRPVVDFMPGGYQYYWLDVNGAWFDKFVPPASPPRFDTMYAAGLFYDRDILPHSPYQDMRGGIVRAFRESNWNSFMWEINAAQSSDTELRFELSANSNSATHGGVQGSQPAVGAGFFVENIFEELDALSEWFFNATQRVLYYVPNNTANHDNDTDWQAFRFETTFLKVLIELEGNQSHPVSNITFSNLAFIDTQYTYLDVHGVPSAGDWAFQYSGAINLIGTEYVTIDHSLFSRLDGNAIFIFGYNRYTNIFRNEFAWIGDTCIGAWGHTTGYDFPNIPPNVRYAHLGINGTDGDQPRMMNISYNFAHEIGINEKQASFYFQAVACQNYVGHNVVFNGPRAGICFNDGFGGSNVVDSNVLFNLCRESSDHGPFNSWDRVPYVTKVRTGEESIVRGWDHVAHNFMISNYGASYQIDNDDVSQYYQSYSNFLVYGQWAFKSNYGGHDIQHWNNIYAYVQFCMQLYDTVPYPSNVNVMVNNTCIVNGTAPYNYAFIGPTFDNPDCTGYYPHNEGGWDARNNTIMIDGGTLHNTGYCDVSMAELQKHGVEMESTVQGWPQTNYVLNQAKQILLS